jgi:hypothetical protein
MAHLRPERGTSAGTDLAIVWMSAKCNDAKLLALPQ